jgi:hypothetical protein
MTIFRKQVLPPPPPPDGTHIKVKRRIDGMARVCLRYHPHSMEEILKAAMPPDEESVDLIERSFFEGRYTVIEPVWRICGYCASQRNGRRRIEQGIRRPTGTALHINALFRVNVPPLPNK